MALVGLPGSGKTTVGQLLARHFDLPLRDLDREIEARLGCSIAQCFEARGEAYFRDLESTVLDELTQGERCVLSTGGGSVLRPRNRACLQSRTQVIYLAATPQQLFPRLKYDTKRPLLQVDNLALRLNELHASRDPLYRDVAHITLQTGTGSAKSVVQQLLSLHPNFSP